MAGSDNVTITSCILESADGVAELWIRCVQNQGMTIYEPIGLNLLSGQRHNEVSVQTVTEAFLLEQWMEDHPKVFSEARTACDQDS